MDTRKAFDGLVGDPVLSQAVHLTSPDSALEFVETQSEQRAVLLGTLVPSDVQHTVKILDAALLWGQVSIRKYASREGAGGITPGVIHILVDLCARATAAREVCFRAFLESSADVGEARHVIHDTLSEVVGEVAKAASTLERDTLTSMPIERLLQAASVKAW